MEAMKMKERDGAFLSLLRAALHGENAALPEGVDWPALFLLSHRHHVLPLVLDAAWRCGDIPPELLFPAQMTAMQMVITQTQRTAAFLSLYREMAAGGEPPAVLKGVVCRALYPQPDNRPSGDEDLLIEPEAFPTVHRALLASGLACDCDAPTGEEHEITYTGPELRIELHLSLFPTDSTAYSELNDLFEGVLARTVTVEAEGVPIRTLSPTDHLLYLLCHAYKHFLHAGVGIRQVCDIGMFAARYDREIDWPRVRESCEQVRIESYCAALFAVAEKHLGFSMPEAFADPAVDESDMLSDILSGGIYSSTDVNRIHSSSITLDAVAAGRKGRKSAGPWRSLFPEKKYLQKRYPYAKKHPILLPVAWANRLADYLGNLRSASPAESLRIGAERVELLREYNIID